MRSRITGSWKAQIIGLSIAVAACGAKPAPTYPFVGSSAVPAAEGQAVVTPGPNGNSQLSVTVRHLAPPERVVAGSTAYVVWVAPLGDGVPQNVGVLKLDAALEGKLATVTPLQAFRLTIGVEADPQVQAPTGSALISTTISPR
ncbi:MAG: hypothetical protein ABIY55_01545 [Kofleriaceae bacterium]